MKIKEDGSHLIDWWKDRRARSPYFEPEMWQRILVNQLHSDLGRRADEGHIAVYSYDARARLPLIKSPTLLLMGDGDVFYKQLENTKVLIPRCRTKIIEGSHNHPTWEKPEEFAQAILEFLENPAV
jgi:pimeloyl-ACP methyl ester carboxylesterase